MTVKVTLDDWSRCFTGSSFVVEMQSVPRVGEEIRIHRSLISQKYMDSLNPPLEFDQLDDNCAEFTVAIVRHDLLPTGHVINICIDIKE